MASSDVFVERERVVVSGRGGKAVITRSPFRVVFQDGRGRTLLREVANRRLPPRSLPPTEDPEPFALERERDHATYAPLSFELGSEARDQWDAGLWNGNMLFSRRSGSVHVARSVVSVRRLGRGVRLLVSTSDPGRRLVVRIGPDRGRALRLRALPTRTAGVTTMGDSFVAGRGEGFYGFGGRHGEVNKHGAKLYGWTEQENVGGRATLSGGIGLLPQFVREGSGLTLEQLGGMPRVPGDLPGGFERGQFPGGPQAAYYPQAQFVSSRGYGVLLNQTSFSRWRMENDRRNGWQVQASAARLDYTVAFGPGRRRAVRSLTSITGRHRLPPAWAEGPTISRAVRAPLPGLPAPESKATYRAKIERDLADIDRFKVRLSAYAFEGWALLDDLDYVRSVIRRLRTRGIRSILYHRAYVSNDALNTQPRGDFEVTQRLGLVARTPAGGPYFFGANGGGPATLLDFTNPATVRWWRRRLLTAIELGADGFMQDFGEQVQDGMRFHDGSTGKTMHNRYPVLFARVSRRILDDYARRRRLARPIWFFNRAGYSGRPGSAAYEMANFPGDMTTDWNAGTGLRSQAPDMLNRAVGGAYGYTTDIGGYADFLSGAVKEELFNRWAEWAALTPYFRVHTSASQGPRMPWSFGPKTLSRWKSLAALHQRALPYIRRLWRSGRRTGLPPTRPMWLAAPEAPGARNDSQQWMLGPNVLVAPVVQEGARSRSVSFPRGCWRRQGADRRRFHGPRRATVRAPLGTPPYFFRCATKPF